MVHRIGGRVDLPPLPLLRMADGSADRRDPAANRGLLASFGLVLILCQVGQNAGAAAAQSLPVAELNDQRQPAGRIIEGELRVELEAVETAWFPRGPDGPRVVTPVFREVGRSPQVPGPLIRTSAGTPVRVAVRNALDRPIVLRGLLDRAGMRATAKPDGFARLPAFAFAEPLVVQPGETGEARFTPAAAVSSFYFARTIPPGTGPAALGPTVAPAIEEGAFMGALVVDPVGAGPPPDERVLMITRWNTLAEGETWKMFANGRSWPFTEQLEYTIGDTVRWRVINASDIDHPMHLHGFYFTVDALGDTHSDTVYAADARPLVVTQVLQEFAAMRLTWVPERVGNWLFHCHLVRHMAAPQMFASERSRRSAATPDHEDEHGMDTMAGLITGITVRPAAGHEEPQPEPVRRIDLWTAERPDVYDGAPELAFVVQEGPEPPAPDATAVPGSPLVLERDEPTAIMVHNRLAIPLSVHWHGLELHSLYDGVGGWSGTPGATRPPIPPGDSVRVVITPPRAGTFIYHTHGEPGHELSQGLYGPFLVLEPGEVRDTDADRVFTLASRGATREPAPAINGVTRPAPERFVPGRTYRLRFLHISADDFKRVRLLRNGEPVEWRPLAKDGAGLPEPARVPGPAGFGIGVGETYDVAWTPENAGIYVLEVTTVFFAARGSVVQRVAFGVGDIAEAALLEAQQPDIVLADFSASERARYVGTFVGKPTGLPAGGGAGLPDLVVSIWEELERLWTAGVHTLDSDDDGPGGLLFPLSEEVVAAGSDLDGIPHLSPLRFRFDATGDRVEVEFGGQVAAVLERVPVLELPEPRLRRFVGAYRTDEGDVAVRVGFEDGALTLSRAGGDPVKLLPISTTRFALEQVPAVRVDFHLEDGRVVALTLVTPAGERTRFEAIEQ